MDGNSKLNAIETKKNKNKMEEKIIMAMEVEHATLKGGKAKPNSRDEWCGVATCIGKIRQRVLHS